MNGPGRRDVARAGLFLALLLSAVVGSLHVLTTFDESRSSATAEAHLRRGDRFDRDDRVQDALSEYGRALELARGARAYRELAQAANRMAALHQRLGELDAALERAGEALAVSERPDARSERSQAYFNLGTALYSMGRAREALRSFELAAAGASHANDPAAEARALLQLGLTATMLDLRETAKRALERSASLFRSDGDAAGEAASARSLGQLLSRMGESQDALEQFAEARELLKPLGDAAGEAILLNATGQVYFDLGMEETALASYEEALALHRRLRHRRREASTLLEIGRCLLALGQDELAARRLGEALRIARELSNERMEADVLSELARLDERAGAPDRAFQRLDAAIRLKRSAGDARYLAYALNEAAGLHVTLGRWEDARPYIDEALELSRRVGDPAAESLALYHLARMRRGEGRLDRARARIEQSLAIVEDLRTKVASYDLRASLLSAVHERYFFLVDVLARLHTEHPDAGYDALALEVSERARARTLLDSLEEAATDLRSGIAPDLLAEERALRVRINEAAGEQLLVLPDTAERAAELQREIAALATEYDRLQSHIRSRSPRYAALTKPEIPQVQDLQTTFLDADTGLLAYALGRERSYLWWVTREGRSLLELPSGRDIETLARRAHSALSSPARGPASIDALERLREVLLGSVSLEGKSRWIVVGEGALHYVPMGALPLPSGEPLATAFEVVRLPSVAVLPLLQARRVGPRPRRTAVVVADPVYEPQDERVPERGDAAVASTTATPRLARLDWSGREAASIAALDPNGAVDVLRGLEANRDRVLRFDLRDYRILHFAAHGIIDPRRPVLSGIVLSLVDESGAPRDGMLSLADIFNLDLSADLVVLSACETALGAEVRGEGLVGLVRGFMYAGAPSVVASSWKVDDEATAELMKLFYRNLFEGMPRGTALRLAQLELRGERRFREPYYWAAFELQGDWR